jgi:hypothetical protein
MTMLFLSLGTALFLATSGIIYGMRYNSTTHWLELFFFHTWYPSVVIQRSPASVRHLIEASHDVSDVRWMNPFSCANGAFLFAFADAKAPATAVKSITAGKTDLKILVFITKKN